MKSLALTLLLASLLGSGYKTAASTEGRALSDKARAPTVTPTASLTQDTVVMCTVSDGHGILVRGNSTVVDTTGRRGERANAYPSLPPPFPDRDQWFTQREPITFHELRWVMYGVTIPALPDRVARIGEYRGIPIYVFSEAAGNRNPEIILLPVAPGCEFQPYYQFNDTGEVRGG